MDSVLEEYRSSLADLTFNSKPLINMLTVLAEENYGQAPDLVRIIENQVYQSPPNQRLPVLYLIDSIVKTYGPYVKLFSTNMIKTFLFVFKKAETKMRHDLFKLRSTWNGMFSKSLLHDLDTAVNQFDPNWPISAAKKSTHPSGLTLDERVAVMMSQPQSAAPEVSKFSSDEDEYNASYQEEDTADSGSPGAGGDILVEEEEILVDDEKYDELEALEKALLKKKQELSTLESLDDQPSTSGNKEPSIGIKFESSPSTSETQSPQVQVPYFIDASAEAYARNISPEDDIDEPLKKRIKSDETDTKRISPPILGLKHREKVADVDMRFDNPYILTPTPDDSLFISEKRDADTQTVNISKDAESQIIINMQDQTTQYRYRKKTKNFLSQYRVPTKSVATYFRIKTKEAQTQYSPPSNTQDATAADSTSGHPDGGNSMFMAKERSALKEYVGALKDDFLPIGYSKQSGLLLQNLYSQRRQGLLCDITLGAEGRVFKAHKSVLAASSDFFYTLFASEEIEKTPLSHIELQGITAKALNLVLDYIYTSVLPMGNLSSVEEIATAAKRLQIHSLMTTCPALEQAIAKKLDMSGWLISNSSLLSPSNKHPYVEAVLALRGNSSNLLRADDKLQDRDTISGAGDAGTGDFICHVDRDVSSKKKLSELGSLQHYDPYSNDEGKYKKKKQKTHYITHSESDSESDIDGIIKTTSKKEKYETGVGASPGMPPASWSETYTPTKTKKKRKQSDHQSTRQPAVYKCFNCSRRIGSRSNYMAHCEAHIRKEEKPYGCQICKKTFWKESAVESHLLKSHSHLTQEQVEKLTTSRVSTLPKISGVKLSPSSSKIKDPTRMKDYVSGKYSGTRKCPECNIIMQNEVALARHLRIRHPNTMLSDEYRYQCEYCLQYFKTGAARAAHIKTHLRAGESQSKLKKRKNPPITVDSGDEFASSDNNFSSNQEEDEIIPQPAVDSQDSESTIKLKLYQCEICGEMFSIQCFYKAHMAGHKKDMEEY